LSWDLSEHFEMPLAPRLTISAACASGLHALIRACWMIQSGQVRRALVVAAEASLHPLFLASFKRLGILASEEEGCRPYDRRRGGFFMSEAAAAVCLEGPVANARSNPPIVAVEKFAMGSDAEHITLSDPRGETLRRMLKEIAVDPVDLVHGHGTGTEANDLVELAAIDDLVVGDSGAVVYSHKAALGHSLGAAGLVAVVINCLAHQRGVIPGNVGTQTAMATKNVRVPRGATRRRVRRSLVLASGFGGPAAAVALMS